MRNIRLTIEYDGTGYAGWQRQPKDKTIQEELERAIGTLTGERVTVHGSGRTDAGVHAEGQVANFKTQSRIPAPQIVHAINFHLPKDIAVLAAEDVAPDFHSRKCAVAKLYRYRILRSEVRRPLRAACVLQVSDPLDAVAMAACAEILRGRHDFAAFASEQFRYRSTVREVFRSELFGVEDELHFLISADGFLYNMVRALVGTLLLVGRGKMTPAQFHALLDSPAGARGGPTAPAHGLCLIAVSYGAPDPA